MKLVNYKSEYTYNIKPKIDKLLKKGIGEFKVNG